MVNYSVIMDDGYGDIRIFYINNYNEETWKLISLLFKRHILLAVVPCSGGHINKKGGWLMSKEDLIDQIYLSEHAYDEEDDWRQYKRKMKDFVEECVTE